MTESITIRHSMQADAEALSRLAELDGRHAPAGPALLGYVDRELVAAARVDDGQAVADPFRYTLEVVLVLSLRAAQERGAAGAPSPPPARTPGSFARVRPRGVR
jgi:predicted transcriptional regulator